MGEIDEKRCVRTSGIPHVTANDIRAGSNMSTEDAYFISYIRRAVC